MMIPVFFKEIGLGAVYFQSVCFKIYSHLYSCLYGVYTIGITSNTGQKEYYEVKKTTTMRSPTQQLIITIAAQRKYTEQRFGFKRSHHIQKIVPILYQAG